MQVAIAIENLVEEHQRVPGNILLALTERIYEVPKKRIQSKTLNGACQNGIQKEKEKEDNSIDKCDRDKTKVS